MVSWPGERAAIRAACVALTVIVTGGLVAADGLEPLPDAPEFLSVARLECLDQTFTTYGDTGRGWSGGDSTWSTALPDDVELFAFSDTFLAPVTPPTRPAHSQFVHNSFVVRSSDGVLHTITGGTRQDPRSLVSPAEPGHWYWLGAITYLDGAVQVPLTEWRPTGPGPLDFALVGSALARFDPAHLDPADLDSTQSAHTEPVQPTSVTPLPGGRGIQWGQWIAPDGGHTLVYGAEATHDTTYLHVARVAGADLRAPFEYWTGRGWSSDQADSARIAEDIYAEFSLTELRPGRYLLVTMRGGEGLSDRLVARFGASPMGPFGPPTTVYVTPETGATGTYRDADVYSYNAHVHPEFSTPTRLVISYNVNSLQAGPTGDVYADVSIYRPRFLAAELDDPLADADTAPSRSPC